MTDFPVGAVLVGASAALLLLRLVLTKEARQDPRWILVVLGAIAVSVVLAVVIGLLLQ